MGIAALIAWIYLLFGRGGFWRFRAEQAGRPRSRGPTVAAIVPARDEADCIGQAVASLLQQDYPLSIFVVDDHSSDSTAAVARQAGAEVIEAGPLPAGWTGKLWAISEGLRHAPGFDYYFLTDADIVHPPGSVSGLMARAEAGNFDLASMMVKLPTESLAERALLPAFVFFFFMLYPPAWGTGAAGGCLLIRRQALERIGGIAAIRGEIIDDCALAREVKRSGGRIWLGLAGRTRSIRRYASFRSIWNMIARTAFAQLRYSTLLLLGTIMAMSIVFVLPPLLGPAGWIAWLLMMLAYLPALSFYERSPLWAPFLPLISLFYLVATVQSAWNHWRGRGGWWKGRPISPPPSLDRPA